MDTTIVSKRESDEAIRMINERRRKTCVRQRGPCLVCRDEIIDYGEPSITHLGRGDTWLDSLFDRWSHWPPKVVQVKGDILVNNCVPATALKYCCELCRIEISKLVEPVQESQDRMLEMQRRQQLDLENDIVTGRVSASPAKRFQLVCWRLTQQDVETLRIMPYKEFLKTNYWQTVRNYVLWKRSYVCELCNAADNLNVHHATYQHRGCEFNHLNELKVLCRSCHAKFHDKFEPAAD